MNEIKSFADLPGYSRSLRRQPFRWARVKLAELVLISRMPREQQIVAMAKVEPLRHRGKGGGYARIKRIESRQPNASKYMPHQGKNEIARRLARMAA
jgi:hypothetical protein